MHCCEWLRQQHAADALYGNILWIDEGYLTLEGVFSVHNSDFWSRANRHTTRARAYQVRFSVKVWVGIVGTSLWALTRYHSVWMLNDIVIFFELFCRGGLKTCP
jgi:hypothetical protein